MFLILEESCLFFQQNGIPVYKPSCYGKLTLQQLKEVFHSCNNTEIPMLATRLENLHEVSDVLCQVRKYSQTCYCGHSKIRTPL